MSGMQAKRVPGLEDALRKYHRRDIEGCDAEGSWRSEDAPRRTSEWSLGVLWPPHSSDAVGDIVLRRQDVPAADREVEIQRCETRSTCRGGCTWERGLSGGSGGLLEQGPSLQNNGWCRQLDPLRGPPYENAE